MPSDSFVPEHEEVEAPKTVMTYPGRPTFCGFAFYTGTKGQFRVCGRHVETLENGLPTGRCSECRGREAETRRRKEEDRAAEHQQAAGGARRSYGGPRR